MSSQDVKGDEGEGRQSHQDGGKREHERMETRDSDAHVIATDDPLLAADPLASFQHNRPQGTTVVETSRIRGTHEGYNPNFVVVPIEVERPRSSSGPENSDEPARRVDQKNGKRNRDQGEGDKAAESKTHQEDKNNPQGPRDKHQDKKQGPSLIRTLIYSGVVALVCGMIGAFAFSHFFGSSKASGEKSSSKDSSSDKSSDSSKGSQTSDKGAEADKLLRSQEAWMSAVKELRRVQEEAKTAKGSEEESKAILDFFKRTLLSAGRPGGKSLSDAFWSGGQGKDVTMRKTLDGADAQVAEAFADQPRQEARVRELLGMAYLNLGVPQEAVKEYERAFALFAAIQGPNHPDTAECRNELAVAYRLADRNTEAGRLFDRQHGSLAQAAALAVGGVMLLQQKKPSEAELKFRESLTIRQKLAPDEWETYETSSMLGQALFDQQKFSAAEPLLVSAYDGMKKHMDASSPPRNASLSRALERIVKLYEAWGKPEEAARWRKDLQTAGSPTQPEALPGN